MDNLYRTPSDEDWSQTSAPREQRLGIGRPSEALDVQSAACSISSVFIYRCFELSISVINKRRHVLPFHLFTILICIRWFAVLNDEQYAHGAKLIASRAVAVNSKLCLTTTKYSNDFK